MSTTQRNDAWRFAVDPQVADILRLQSLIALELNHHHFEDPPRHSRLSSAISAGEVRGRIHPIQPAPPIRELIPDKDRTDSPGVWGVSLPASVTKLRR
jgi:hypothetical protein